MNKLKLIASLVTLLIQMPIWFFLIYQLLAATSADRLTWFLFWAYVPISIFCAIIIKIAESKL